MPSCQPGEAVYNAPLSSQIDFSRFAMRESPERSHSHACQLGVREPLWMHTGQVATPDSGRGR